MADHTKALIRAVSASLDANRQAIEPMLAQRPEPEFRDPEIRFVQAAQNTLRTCLEATLEAAIPYSRLTCVELAVRLASYAISALPLEEQAQAIQAVVGTLPTAHRQRIARGVSIQAEWQTDGVRHPNMPKGRA